jgi:hypothetical protein
MVDHTLFTAEHIFDKLECGGVNLVPVRLFLEGELDELNLSDGLTHPMWDRVELTFYSAVEIVVVSYVNYHRGGDHTGGGSRSDILYHRGLAWLRTLVLKSD